MKDDILNYLPPCNQSLFKIRRGNLLFICIKDSHTLAGTGVLLRRTRNDNKDSGSVSAAAPLLPTAFPQWVGYTTPGLRLRGRRLERNEWCGHASGETPAPSLDEGGVPAAMAMQIKSLKT
jgi:hypothetical protein